MAASSSGFVHNVTRTNPARPALASSYAASPFIPQRLFKGEVH